MNHKVKKQFNMHSLGENKAAYRAENKICFPRWKLQGKSTFVYIVFFIPSW